MNKADLIYGANEKSTSMHYLLICGSRGFTNTDIVYFTLDSRVEEFGEDLLVIEGGCEDSPDLVAEEWCVFHEIPFLRWPARWNKGHLRKAEGPYRNYQMIYWMKNNLANIYRCETIAFWDGKSHGTASTFEESKRAQLITSVVNPEGKIFTYNPPPHRLTWAEIRESISRTGSQEPNFGN